MKDSPSSLSVDPSSPDDQVENRFFQRGVDVEGEPPREELQFVDEQDRRQRRFMWIGGVATVMAAVGLLVVIGRSSGPAELPLASMAGQAPALPAPSRVASAPHAAAPSAPAAAAPVSPPASVQALAAGGTATEQGSTPQAATETPAPAAQPPVPPAPQPAASTAPAQPAASTAAQPAASTAPQPAASTAAQPAASTAPQPAASTA